MRQSQATETEQEENQQQEPVQVAESSDLQSQKGEMMQSELITSPLSEY